MPRSRNRRDRLNRLYPALYNLLSDEKPGGISAAEEFEVDTSDKLDFFPNSCPVCQKTDKLETCGECCMINYCNEEHRKEHSKKHQKLCNVVKSMIKERRTSHLYEHLKGLRSERWRAEVELLADEVREKMGRFLHLFETKVLLFPRVCFVCYEATQENLKNCPGCPAASFCKNHPSSDIHDQYCSQIKEIHEFIADINFAKQKNLMLSLLYIMTTIKIRRNKEPPTSTIEFLCQFIVPHMNWKRNEMIFFSNILNDQLMVFNAIRILNYSQSNIVIHIEGERSTAKDVANTSKYWEILLHLLPHLENITILFLNEDFEWKMNLDLCQLCKKKNMNVISRSFSWTEYVTKSEFQIPNVMILPNIQLEDADDGFLIFWQVKLTRLRNMMCPLVFTTYKLEEPTEFRKILKCTFGNFQPRYDGINKLASLSYFLHPEDTICKLHQHLIVIDPPKNASYPPKSFFAAYCPKCPVGIGKEACTKCKMIFYCNSIHKKEHKHEHQDICNVVSKMLTEIRGASIFEKLNKKNQESWVKAKGDLILKVRTKLGRELSNFEKEMFLFPKTCLICYESDLNKLENCRQCGTIFCNSHRRHPTHTEEECSRLEYAYNFSNISQRPESFYGDLKAQPSMDINMFANVDEFISEAYEFKYQNQLDNITENIVDPNKLNAFFAVQEVIFSNLHTRPLTMAYVLKELEFEVNTTMVIHVIGATGIESGSYGYWRILFYLLGSLRDLSIIFIGPEVFNTYPDESYLDNYVDRTYFVLNENVFFKVKCYAMKYDEYCKSEFFVKPDVIVGFNLNLHESEIGISECTWKETIITVREMNVPFILTAGTKDRAKKDHRSLGDLLGNPVVPFFLEFNPFSGEIPERDFETNGTLLSNQYLIVYEKLSKNATEQSSNLENPDLQKLADLKIKKKKKKKKKK